MKQSLHVALAALVAASPLVLPDPAGSCSRIFWNDNGQAKVVARTVDLFRSDEATIAVFPRGVARRGVPGETGGLEWKAKHASVVATAFGTATSDGLNEKGLSANLLYLDETKYEARDGRPALSNLMWAQYVLDSFATVEEALASLDEVQIVATPAASGRSTSRSVTRAATRRSSSSWTARPSCTTASSTR
jgi:penicillin V acylase-like amidase (Ntn superfamily)